MSPENLSRALEKALETAKELRALRDNGQIQEPYTTDEIIGEQPAVDFVAVHDDNSEVHKGIANGELEIIHGHGDSKASMRQIVVRRVVPVVAAAVLAAATGTVTYKIIKRRRRHAQGQ